MRHGGSGQVVGIYSSWSWGPGFNSISLQTRFMRTCRYKLFHVSALSKRNKKNFSCAARGSSVWAIEWLLVWNGASFVKYFFGFQNWLQFLEYFFYSYRITSSLAIFSFLLLPNFYFQCSQRRRRRRRRWRRRLQKNQFKPVQIVFAFKASAKRKKTSLKMIWTGSVLYLNLCCC